MYKNMPPIQSNDQSNNYAFIDGTNLSIGVRSLGWKVDYARFRFYLKDEYDVTKAYVFLGFTPEQAGLYRSLQESGFILEFKPALPLKDGKLKGNCDAELVLRTILEIENYENAVIVSGDGDFHCLVKHLADKGKLKMVLAPSSVGCSKLLKRLVPNAVSFIEGLKGKLEYKQLPKK